MSYLPCFSSLFIRRIYGDSDKAGGLEIKWYTSDVDDVNMLVGSVY